MDRYVNFLNRLEQRKAVMANVVALRKTGCSYAAISTKLHIPESSVRNIHHKYVLSQEKHTP